MKELINLSLRSNEYWIAGLIWLELLVLTQLHTHNNHIILPAALLGIGLVLCMSKPTLKDTPSITVPPVTIWVFLVFVIGYIIHRSPIVFEFIPIDYKIADMLPVMEVMTERAVSGGKVYDIIPEIWGGMEPIYLPGLWIPFVPAKLAAMDIRWVGTFGMIGLTFVFIFFKNGRPRLSSFLLLAIPLTYFLFWHYRIHLNIVSMTNEGLVFFYYGLLCCAITRKWPVTIGLALGLILLSRYAIAPWCVMIFIAYCLHESKAFIVRLFLSGLTTGVVLLTLGSAWDRIPRFLSLSEHYLEALMSNQDKYQPLVDQSLSLVRYVNYENIPLMHQALTVLSIGLPFLCLCCYQRTKGALDFRLFALVTMKLSLIVFFGFLTMPYHYLYYTSFIISLSIGAYVLRS